MKKIFLFIGVFLTVVCVLFSCSVEDTTSVSLEDYDFFIYPSSDLESSDTKVEISSEESESSKTVEITYILNKNTRKFHHPDCRYVELMKEENMLFQKGNRDTIIYRGFSPCQHCNP